MFVSAFFFSLSFLLFRRRGRDPEAMLLAFAFLIQAFNLGVDSWLTGGNTSDLPNWLEATFGVFGWWCMLVGMCAFPDGRFATRWSRIATLVPTAFLLVNMATNFRLLESDLALYIVDVPIFITIAVSLWLRYRALEPGTERQQIKVVALGGAVLVLSAIAGVALNEPAIQRPLGPAASSLLILINDDIHDIAYPLAILIALLRYRLYDADNAITRSAGYATLTVTLVAVFAFTEQFIQTLGQQYLGNSLGSLANGVGAAVSAVMIAPLHHRISEWAEDRFRNNLVALRKGLPLLVADLRETVSPTALADATLERVERGVRATHAAMVLGEKFLVVRDVEQERAQKWLATVALTMKKRLESKRSDPIFPIRIPLAADGVGHIGWLLLGARPDGSLYGREEQRALADIADPVARALAVAGERQLREKARAKVDATRDAAIASLEQRLTQLEARFDRLGP